MRAAKLAIAVAFLGAVRVASADVPPPAPDAARPPASSQPAPAASPPAQAAPQAAAQPAAEVPTEAAADTDQRMDIGLEKLRGKHYDDAATIFYDLYRKLPLGDSRRDLASYHLATALAELGFTQAAVEHYMEIISGRRALELMDKALVALKPLYEQRLVDERRFVEGLLYGGQFNNLSPEVADFVEYLQSLTDIRHGFSKWGRARLEVLAHSNRPYSFSARYGLAVERIALHEDDAAANELRAIIASTTEIPFEIRNKARIALGRILYEKKLYEEAWQVYSKVDSPLPLQDIVMIERAWDRVAGGDQQRALGLLVGLGAPVFRDIFSPERYLIRGLALRRLCQFRAAHLAVRDFRATYGAELEKIKGRTLLKNDPTIRSWAIAGTPALRDYERINDVLIREKGELGTIGDKPLRDHLEAIYANGIAVASRTIDRGLEAATEKVADELLRIDEQMSLVDYEIGAGLFKSGSDGKAPAARHTINVPTGTGAVYFKFDGEYWSDELGDYAVLADDRCL